MEQKKNDKKWMRYRHRVVRNLAWLVLYPYSVIRYGIRVTPFREQGDRAYLILMNHQTAFDQFFIGMAVKGPIYYMATEDIFSLETLIGNPTVFFLSLAAFLFLLVLAFVSLAMAL